MISNKWESQRKREDKSPFLTMSDFLVLLNCVYNIIV